MAFTPYSAKNAKVRFGGSVVTLTAKKWTVTPAADLLETSNFEGAGAKEFISGMTQAEVSIEMDDDGAANLFDLGWTAGATITSLLLYLNDTTGPFWNFASFIVQQVPQTADAKASMQNTFSGTATGTVVYPTGNAV